MRAALFRLAMIVALETTLLGLAASAASAHVNQAAVSGTGNTDSATAGILLTPNGFDLYPQGSQTRSFTVESVFILNQSTFHGLESGIFAGSGRNIFYSTCFDWFYTTDNGVNEVDNSPIACLATNSQYTVHADVHQTGTGTPWSQKLDGTGYTSANVTLTFDYANETNFAQGEALRDGDSMGYGSWNSLMWGQLNSNNTISFFSWGTLNCTGLEKSDQGEVLTGSDAYACNRFSVTAFDDFGPKQEVAGAGVDSSVSLYASGLDPFTWNFRNWTSLAATLTGAPAIVQNHPSNTASGEPSQPIFIVTGSTQHLYYRTDGTSWQLLSNGTCYDNPAAYEDSSGNLTVACRGVNNVLYYATGAVSNSTVSLGGFSSLAGGSNFGPAVALVQGQLMFFVSGLDGNIYTRTLTTGWTNTGWPCTYHPAAATSQSGTAYFACNGAGNALSYSVNNGGGWSTLASAGGTVMNGPGMAAYSQGAVVFIEGVGGQVYKTVISASTAPPAPWRVHSNGTVQYGVGASAL